MAGTILSGMLDIDGQAVRLCSRFCATPCGTLCGRPSDHPDDEYGHLCPACVAQSV